MKMMILPILAAFALSGCVDKEGATRALVDQGYTAIVLDDYSPWSGCGKDDLYATEFHATSIAGHHVDGVVCDGGGWGKGSTIRTF